MFYCIVLALTNKKSIIRKSFIVSTSWLVLFTINAKMMITMTSFKHCKNKANLIASGSCYKESYSGYADSKILSNFLAKEVKRSSQL